VLSRHDKSEPKPCRDYPVRPGRLGCNCPDAVFQQVKVQCGSSAVKSCAADYEIRIGDRLLIVVTSSAAELATVSRLENVILEGKQARDMTGLNRFRLVVVTSEASLWREELFRAFDTISSRDEKTYLHVIEQEDMPVLCEKTAQKK
jgi:hypothetical protein